MYDLERLAENARAIVGALGGAGSTTGSASRSRRTVSRRSWRRCVGSEGLGADRGRDRRLLAGRGGSLPWTHGWQPEEISFTGTNLSERDLDALLPTGVHLNLDAISQVERVGRLVPAPADRAPGQSRVRVPATTPG